MTVDELKTKFPDWKARGIKEKVLPDIINSLPESETIEDLTYSFYLNAKKDGGEGVLIATGKKLYFLYKKEILESIPYSAIYNISAKNGWLTTKLILNFFSDKEMKISNIPIHCFQSFVDFIKSRVSASEKNLEDFPLDQRIKAQFPDWTKRDIKEKELEILEAILPKGEKIQDILGATIDGQGAGAILATNKRVLLARKGSLSKEFSISYLYNKIDSIAYKKGSYHSEIIMGTAGDTIKVTGVVNEFVIPFVQLVESNMQKGANPVVEVKESSNDIYAELEKVKELLDKGILTQEEFDKQKAKILG